MSSTFSVRTLAPLATQVARSTRLATASSAPDRWVAAIVLAAGLAAPATLIVVPHATFIERAVLSLTAYVGLVVVMLSWIGTSARVRSVRGWIAVGFADWVVLQTLLNIDHSAGAWVAQVVMLGGVAIASAGAYQAVLAGRTSWREQIAVYLDAAVVTATASSVLMVLFLERALVDPRVAAALLFAVVFVAILSATVVLDLAVLAELAPKGAYAVLSGLALLGVGFVLRAGVAVDAPSGHDTWLVAAGVLIVAYGTATWNDLVDTGRRYVRIASLLRTVLPIAAAAVAVTLLLLVSPQVEGLARLLLRGLVAIALVGVVVRQTLLLAEREGVMRHLNAARGAAERRTQQIAGMEAVGRLLAVAGPTNEAMDAVAELVREHFGYQRIAVYLASDGAELRLGAQRGYTRLFETLDSSTGIAGRVARTRRGELVQDALSDPDYLMADPTVRSEICAPMLSEGELLGVLVVEAGAEEPLDETDFAAVLAVADQLAASIALGVRRQRLIRERNFTSAVLDTVGAVVVVTDPDGRVVRFNPACTEVSGYSLDELAMPDAFTRLVPDEQQPVVEAVVAEVLAMGVPRSLENEWIRKDGSRRTITWWNRPVLNDDGTVDYVIATGIDITERKVLEVQLAHRALHDPLTALPNRALFMDRLEHALRRREPTQVAAMFIDLDDFKVINDTMGHEAGDRVLIEVARRLSAAVRPGDTAARVGGDEFAVVLEDLPSAEEASAVATRVLAAVCGPEIDVGERTVRIDASIGVATAAANSDMNADRLLRNADIAMYAAKSAGGAGCEVFHPRMYSATTKRRALHAQLSAAIENEEFIVHYQPIVRLRGARLTGMEALVRWNHPRDGLLRPQHFIEVAEQSGLIVPIGARVIRDACQQMARWLAEDAQLAPEWVSVNVSSRQFEDANLFDTVSDALNEAGVEPSRLVIEITESLVVSGSDTTTNTITRLTELGVRFAVDDFGTGYSSLSYLRRFPIEFLKIDRSFITGVESDSQQQAFVGALVVMGKTLGLRVLSEGIETQLQYRAMRQLGCEFGQGYFIGEPAAAADIRRTLPVIPERAA